MRINLAKIRKTFGASEVFEFKEPLESLGSDDGAVALAGPVEARVKATNVGSSILLEGKVFAEIKLACSRCLEVFLLPAEIGFTEEICHASNEQAYLADHPEAEEEKDYAVFTSDEVDLEPLVGEQVVLALPMKPLCSEECKGLCPGCGRNLNLEKCTCDLEPVDPRLAGLAQFLNKRQ